MTKRYVLSGALAVMLVFMLSSCRTATGGISGRVVDPDGAPVDAARIEVAGVSVLTDEEGNYSVADVSAGDHTIWATKTGIGELTSEVTVRAEATTRFDIVLSPVGE